MAIAGGVLIHVQHLLGIGHYDRAMRIAAALAKAGERIVVASGGFPVPGAVPGGVERVQLEPLRAADTTFRRLVDASGAPVDDALRRRRRDALLALYDELRPGAVVMETYPFGRRALRVELDALMSRIAQSSPRPLLASSVRDILQPPAGIEREQEMLAKSRGLDAILVHADARFARLEETFAGPAELPPTYYTGFVAGPAAPAAQGAARDEVVVSAGGGAVGAPLLEAALEARGYSRAAVSRWRVLAGPNLPEARLRELAAGAPAGVVVERVREGWAARLALARVSVSQCGYNTVLDVMRSGARAVLVPFEEGNQLEQRRRAERLAALDLAIVVDAPEPVALAAAIDDAIGREKWGRFDFDCDGAPRSAALIAELAARGRHARRGLGL